jgi:hypothetical protein
MMTFINVSTHTVVTPYNFIPPPVENWLGLETKLLVSLIGFASLPAVAGFCWLIIAN